MKVDYEVRVGGRCQKHKGSCKCGFGTYATVEDTRDPVELRKRILASAQAEWPDDGITQVIAVGRRLPLR